MHDTSGRHTGTHGTDTSRPSKHFQRTTSHQSRRNTLASRAQRASPPRRLTQYLVFSPSSVSNASTSPSDASNHASRQSTALIAMSAPQLPASASPLSTTLSRPLAAEPQRQSCGQAARQQRQASNKLPNEPLVNAVKECPPLTLYISSEGVTPASAHDW